MFSLLCAVWKWLAESADILLDLAVTGRAANNAFVIAIVSGLAIVRVAAFLLFVLPGLIWIWGKITYKEKHGTYEETHVRVGIIVLIIASIVFEIWAVPGRKGNADTNEETTVETRIETERG